VTPDRRALRVSGLTRRSFNLKRGLVEPLVRALQCGCTKEDTMKKPSTSQRIHAHRAPVLLTNTQLAACRGGDWKTDWNNAVKEGVANGWWTLEDGLNMLVF
jgi:hypothetical protein